MVIVALLLVFQWLPVSRWVDQLQEWIGSLGFWAPVVFGLIYFLATIGMVPGWILTTAAGALFGIGQGFIVASIASTSGAAAAFLLARYLARSQVEQLARQNDRFAAVDAAIAQGGWRVVGLLRLSPAIPFNLQNYLYGMTAIGFWRYVVVSWIAMMPGTLLYVYLGHVAGLATGGNSPANVWRWVLLGVGLLATLAVTIYLTRLARRKLAEFEKDRSLTNPSDAGSG